MFYICSKAFLRHCAYFYLPFISDLFFNLLYNVYYKKTYLFTYGLYYKKNYHRNLKRRANNKQTAISLILDGS